MISSKTVLIATLALGSIVIAGPHSHGSSGIGGMLLKGVVKGGKHWLKEKNMQDSQQLQYQGDSQGYPQPGQQQFPRGDSDAPPTPAPAPVSRKQRKRKHNRRPKAVVATAAIPSTGDQTGDQTGSQGTQDTLAQSQVVQDTSKQPMRRSGGGAVSKVLAEEGEGLAKEGVVAGLNAIESKRRKRKAKKAQALAQQDPSNAAPVNSRDYDDIIELLERALDDDIFERDYDDDVFERDDDDLLERDDDDLLEREDDDEPFARDDDDLLERDDDGENFERDEELEEFFARDNGLFDELD